MKTTTILLGITALIPPLAATPISPNTRTPTRRSQYFTLIGNLTNPSASPFNQSVQHWNFQTDHLIADYPGITAPDYGSAIWLNGSAASPANLTAQTVPFINYWGMTIFSAALRLDVIPETNKTGVMNVTINSWTPAGGEGSFIYGGETKGLGVTTDGSPRLYWGTPDKGTFIACDDAANYYQDIEHKVYWYGPRVKYLRAEVEGKKTQVPTQCVTITLMAQCAGWPFGLTRETVDKFNYQIVEVDCFQKVREVVWS